MLQTAGSTAIPGWTVASGSVLWIGPDGVADDSPFRGLGLFNAVLLRSGADAILQTLDGLPALLSFEATGTARTTDRDRLGGALDVLVAGTEEEVSASSDNMQPTPWRVTFLTRGLPVPLRLSGIDNTANGYVIVDNIDVTPQAVSAVPEHGGGA